MILLKTDMHINTKYEIKVTEAGMFYAVSQCGKTTPTDTMIVAIKEIRRIIDAYLELQNINIPSDFAGFHSDLNNLKSVPLQKFVYYLSSFVLGNQELFFNISEDANDGMSEKKISEIMEEFDK